MACLAQHSCSTNGMNDQPGHHSQSPQLFLCRHIDHLLWSPNGLYLLVRQANTPSVTVYDVRRGSHRQAAFGAAVVQAVWLSNRALLLCCAHQLFRLDISHSDLTPVSIFTTKELGGARSSRGASGKGWVAMSRLGSKSSHLLLLGSDGRVTTVEVDLLKCQSRTSSVRLSGDSLVVSRCGTYACAFSGLSTQGTSDQLTTAASATTASMPELHIAALQKSGEQVISSASRVRLHSSHGEVVAASFLPSVPSTGTPMRAEGSPPAGDTAPTGQNNLMLALVTSHGFFVCVGAGTGQVVLQWCIPPRTPLVLDAAGHHSSPRRVVSADIDTLTGGIVVVWASGLVSIAWIWPEQATQEDGCNGGILGAPRLIAECVPTGRGIRVYAASGARQGAGSWIIYQNQDKGMLRDPDSPFLSHRLRATLCGCIPCSLPREAATMPQVNGSSSTAATANLPGAPAHAAPDASGLCSTRVDLSGRSVLPVTASWAGHGLHACTIGCKGGFTSTLSVALPPLSQIWPGSPAWATTDWPLLWCASTGVALGRAITPLRQRAADTSLYDTLLVLLHDISNPFATYQHVPRGLQQDERLLATAGDGSVPLRIASMTLLIAVLLMLVLEQFAVIGLGSV